MLLLLGKQKLKAEGERVEAPQEIPAYFHSSWVFPKLGNCAS